MGNFSKEFDLKILEKILSMRIPISLYRLALKLALKQPKDTMPKSVMKVQTGYIDYVYQMQTDYETIH